MKKNVQKEMFRFLFFKTLGQQNLAGRRPTENYDMTKLLS